MEAAQVIGEDRLIQLEEAGITLVTVKELERLRRLERNLGDLCQTLKGGCRDEHETTP